MNISTFFNNHRIRQLTVILLLVGTLACIFPIQYPQAQWWMSHNQWVAVAYVFIGLFFLVIDNRRLMFASFGCSAAICFYAIEVLKM